MTTYAIIDIETAPDPARMDLPVPDEWVKEPANYKKAETIAAYREERRISWPAELYRRGSLDPFYGRIVAIGSDCIGGTSDVITAGEFSEDIMLNGFWSRVSQCEHLVGYGITGFDWEWMLMRSARYGLCPPKHWDTSPFTRHGLIDLQVLLNQSLRPKAGRTLEAVAEYFQLDERPIGSGADVPLWVEQGAWDKIAEHCASDIRTAAALLQKIGPTYLGWPEA